MSVTIKDVAKAANVSISTVSLVINNSDLVKMETRYKVEQAIKELGYTPNLSARSLVTKKNRVIGVALMTCNSSTNWFSFDEHVDTYLTEILPSIEKEINKSKYSMLLEHFCANGGDKKLPTVMSADRVDGMLIAGGLISDQLLAEIEAVEIPTVLIGSRSDILDYVDSDTTKGVYLGTRHLIENGHREIAFINSSIYSQTSERKLKGFEMALKEAGLALNQDWVRHAAYSGKAGYEAMLDLWKEGVRPTAILAGHESIAIGALHFLYDQGLRCPDDVSIVSYEDSILAEFNYPPLTTIKVPKEQMGQEACRVLLNRLKRPNAKTVELIIEPILRKRKSVRQIR